METYISKSIVVSNFYRFDLLSFRSTVAAVATENQEFFQGQEKGYCRIYQSDKGVWHCLALWSYLSYWDFFQTSIWQNDHEACPKLKFHPYYPWQQAKQASLPWKQIGFGVCFQYFYVRAALHDYQNVCLYRRSITVALFRKLEGLGGDFKSRH